MDNVLIVNSQLTPDMWDSGAMILVDKPLEWTSFDVVNKLRWTIKNRLSVKKYKVGHAGTLDPLATGLLLICIGKYTKKIELLQGLDKSYCGTIKMFETTASYDAEFLPDQYFPRQELNISELQTSADGFMGSISQIPPIFSAIKKNGVPLYKLARKGKSDQVQIEARKVVINRFDIVGIQGAEVEFAVDCSKGTYIRSLAFDFGRQMNSGAHLSSLKRTAIGSYSIDDAWQLESLIELISESKVQVA